MPRREEKLDYTDLMARVSEGLNQAAKTTNLYGYVPHAKQIEFHTNVAKTRLYIGGNRSGKTVGGCVEDIWWLRGTHPYRKTPPPPVRGRIIGVDFDNGVEKILKPSIARWIPPSDLINGSWEDSYVKSTRTLELANGSFLEFMSYVQEVDKFAGTSRHFIHYDEEPPKGIYGENKLRLLDTGGEDWFTMTPVQGMTWIYDEVYLPGINGENKFIGVVTVDIVDNPHIDHEEIERILAGLDENEVKARKSGTFVQMGGLIFKSFNDSHIIEPVDLKKIWKWRWFASMDHGFNNPTAWLWHAISPEGKIITFHEHFQNEWTVEQHAKRIKEINAHFGRAPEIYIGDPAIEQRNAATGHSIRVEYMKNGIPIANGNNNVRAGIDKMNNYLKHPDRYWLITENCPNLIRELRRYRWKVHKSLKLRHENNPFEEPHKKDDHAVDSARYAFTLMPNLELPKDERGPRTSSQVVHETTHARTFIPMNRDPRSNYVAPKTEWTYMDETVGGEW